MCLVHAGYYLIGLLILITQAERHEMLRIVVQLGPCPRRLADVLLVM
jgi:hypothetical protein